MHPPSYLSIMLTYLPIYFFYIAKYLINYLFIFSNLTPRPHPTYQFIKVCPNSWMMNTGPHM